MDRSNVPTHQTRRDTGSAFLRYPHNTWFSFWFPSALFLVLVLLPYHPAPPRLMDPLSDGSDCPLLEWSVLTPYCGVADVDPTSRWIRCAPPSPADSDWVAHFLFTAPAPSFDYDLWAVDAVLGDFRYSSAWVGRKSPTYPGFSCTKASSSSVWCTLRGSPYRSYNVFAWCRGTHVMAAPLLSFEFFQASGFNVRYSAILHFSGLALFGLVIMALGYWLRPGGRVFSARRWPRWALVSLTSAVGGLTSGLIFALRPADFGGREQIVWGNVPVHIVTTTVLIVVAGLIADFCRRRYLALPESRRTFVLLLVVISTAMLVVVYGALALKVNSPDVKLIHFKFRYYIYFFAALWLALITVVPSEWPLVARKLSGSIPTTRDRALTVFVSGILIAVVVNFVAIAVGEICHMLKIGHLAHGFYKPASAWGLLVAVLPAYFALTIATNLGEERPLWVQDISRYLSRFHHHPAGVLPRKKAQIARAILRILVSHHRSAVGFRSDPRFIAPISGGCLAVLNEFAAKEADRQQLAEELNAPLPELSQQLDEIKQKLVAAQQNALRSEWVSPLALFDPQTHTGILGTLRLRCTLEKTALPTNVDLTVQRNGTPVAPSDPIVRQVKSLVMRVAVLLGPSPAGEIPFLGQHVTVGFDYPTQRGAETFSGESYELTLALLLVQAATGAAPLVPWVATGRLDPTGEELLAVDDVPAKWQAVSSLSHHLFVISTHDAPALAGVDAVLLTAVGDGRADKIRRDLVKHLRRGRPVVLAAPTLSLLVEVLFPRSL